MEKKHTYEYEVDTTTETGPANVVRLVGQGKRVLEIGCGPGSITKVMAQQGGCQVTGLELDPEAIKKVTPYCVKVMQADLNSSTWPNLLEGEERYDVVVAADVLEHLYDPWKALQRMIPLINENGYLVISLPHVGHAAVMACLINGDFEYRDWGLLDRTHIRFFCLKNIEALFAQANLKIIEARYITKPPEATEFAAAWSKIPSSLKSELRKIDHSEVYQVVVKVVPLNYAGEAVSLIPPKHKFLHSPFSTTQLWKTRLGQRLSSESKERIRKIFRMLGIKL